MSKEFLDRDQNLPEGQDSGLDGDLENLRKNLIKELESIGRRTEKELPIVDHGHDKDLEGTPKFTNVNGVKYLEMMLQVLGYEMTYELDPKNGVGNSGELNDLTRKLKEEKKEFSTTERDGCTRVWVLAN